jgi:hypothetical protein
VDIEIAHHQVLELKFGFIQMKSLVLMLLQVLHPNREYSSLITGGWDSNTDLRLDIGPNGFVTGAGGNGGTGGSVGYLGGGKGNLEDLELVQLA